MTLLIFATVIAGSALYIESVRLIGIEYQHDLDLYDLDHDGEFSESEYTSAARAAMKRLTNDTGRIFAPVAAPIATTVWVLSVFGICYLVTLGISDIRAYRHKLRAEQPVDSNPH